MYGTRLSTRYNAMCMCMYMLTDHRSDPFTRRTYTSIFVRNTKLIVCSAKSQSA